MAFSHEGSGMGLSAENLDYYRKEYERTMLYILDEMSFIGADLFYDIHKRLGDIHCQRDELFGYRGMSKKCLAYSNMFCKDFKLSNIDKK